LELGFQANSGIAHHFARSWIFLKVGFNWIIDIVQVSDMFTTAASIAGVKNEIPNDRVTNGVGQSALLLSGEGKSRRDYIFHYNKAIDAELAALEKKFGKKPNIIYILADDIGWGELGWQGGGKHRGTPTRELDKMTSASPPMSAKKGRAADLTRGLPAYPVRGARRPLKRNRSNKSPPM
jgi:hypothetical protein